jgi:hypothetical protein
LKEDRPDTGIDIGIFRESEFYQCVVLDLAQDDPDGRMFVIESDFPVIVVDIYLHLAEIAVGNFSNLKVDQDITPEDTVVEDEIYIVVVGIEGKPLLSRFEEETFAQFRNVSSLSMMADSRSLSL